MPAGRKQSRLPSKDKEHNTMPTTEIPNGISYTSDRRGYQPPPPPPPPFRAPDVAVYALKTEGGTTVQQAHAAIQHANSEFQKHVAATDAIREHFTPEGYQAQIGRFQNTSAARAVDTALESVTARRDAAAAQVDKVKKSLSPDSDVAAELRATRYRDRMLRTLDSKDPGQLFDAANDLIAGASREEVGTLLQELPAYLQSRGSDAAWLDAAVAQHVPEYAQARAQLKQAEAAFQITRSNAKSVREAFAAGHRTVIFADPSRYDPDLP